MNVVTEKPNIIGKRIELVKMGYDPNPIMVGTKGTVSRIDDIGTIFVNWDNGRRLGLVTEEGDEYKLI